MDGLLGVLAVEEQGIPNQGHHDHNEQDVTHLKNDDRIAKFCVWVAESL